MTLCVRLVRKCRATYSVVFQFQEQMSMRYFIEGLGKVEDDRIDLLFISQALCEVLYGNM